MTLTAIDWAIVVAYFVLCTGMGLYFTRRGGESLDQYFLSGRQAQWWLAGTAMVATTFAADTPLVVTGLVATKGVAGNWLWWNFVMSGMLTVFFFARLWRRARVMTDVELAEERYGGALGAPGERDGGRYLLIRMDAAPHPGRVPVGAMVGGMVPGRRAGRRRLCGATNLQRAHGARRRARHALLSDRALRPAAV